MWDKDSRMLRFVTSWAGRQSSMIIDNTAAVNGMSDNIVNRYQLLIRKLTAM